MKSPVMKKSSNLRAYFSANPDQTDKEEKPQKLQESLDGESLNSVSTNGSSSHDEHKKSTKKKPVNFEETARTETRRSHTTEPVKGTADDGTKQFRDGANLAVESIFADLKKNLVHMEYENRLSSLASIKKEENAYFRKIGSDTLSAFKSRQQRANERLKASFTESLKSKDHITSAHLHQVEIDAKAETNDAIIQSLDECQRMNMENDEIVYDYRREFDMLLKQLEIQHTKIRKHLTAAQERHLQDKKVLHELEVANQTEEMRIGSNKIFQFDINHQKAMDKKVSEHFRNAQNLVLRQTKEMFDFELDAEEQMHQMKSHIWEEMNNLRSHQRAEKQALERSIREIHSRQSHNSHLLKHLLSLKRLSRQQKEVIKIELAMQSTREKGLEQYWTDLMKSTRDAMENLDEHYLGRAIIGLPPSLYIFETLYDSFKKMKDNFEGIEVNDFSDNDFQQLFSSDTEKNATDNDNLRVQDPQILRDELKKAENELKALSHEHAQKTSQMKKKFEEEGLAKVHKLKDEHMVLKKKQAEVREALEIQQLEELRQLRITQAKEKQMAASIMVSEHTMLLERKRLNSMLQRVVDGIITIDSSGNILRLNSSVEAMFGYTSKEILGKNIQILQPEELGQVHDSYLRNYLETGIKKIIGIGTKNFGRKKDGTIFPISLSVSEVKSDGVHIFTGVVRDLTKDMQEKEKMKKEIEKREIDTFALSKELEVTRARSTDLLNAILPPSISARLLKEGAVPPEKFNDVSVLFTEIANYAELATKYEPMDIVDLLNELYCVFDEVIAKYDVFRVETKGDSYVIASGVPNVNKNHVSEIAKLALHLQKAIQYVKIKNHPNVEIKVKIGIHCGPIVAGIVGTKTPRYCLFGETVDTASRMRSSAEAGKIQLSQAVYQNLSAIDGKPFAMAARGDVMMKGKGSMLTFYLDGMQGFKIPNLLPKEKNPSTGSANNYGGVYSDSSESSNKNKYPESNVRDAKSDRLNVMAQ